MKKKLFTIMILLCSTVSYAQFTINGKSQIFVGDSTEFRPEQAPSMQDLKFPMRETMNIVGSTCLINDSGYLLKGYEKFNPEIILTQPVMINPSFYVKTTGEIYTKEGLVQSSDETLKENISLITNPLDKINAMKGVKYTFKEKKSTSKARNASATDSSQERIGLIAQDVEKVCPQAVRMLPDSTKGVMYGDLVAVLIEGIKQLNAEVKSLKSELDELKKTNKGNIVPENKSGGKEHYPDAALYQNTPNPFNQDSEIAYTIPQETNASIGIYDLNGKQLKNFPLTETNGRIKISATEFSAGIYIYSLLVNGVEVDSKRMIISK